MCCLLPLLTWSACSSNVPSVEASQLFDEDKEILGFTDDSSMLRYFYLTESKNVEIRMDVYQNGSLIDSKTYDGGTFSETKGSIFVFPDQFDDAVLNATIHGSEATSSYRLEADIDVTGMHSNDTANYDTADASFRTFIKDNVEYYAFYSSFNRLEVVTPTDTADNSEFSLYPDYAISISCAFHRLKQPEGVGIRLHLTFWTFLPGYSILHTRNQPGGICHAVME